MKTSALLFFLIYVSSLYSPELRPIAWKKLKTPEEVRTALDARIATKATMEDVTKRLSREKPAYLHSYGDSAIAFTSQEYHAAFLISRKWLIRFHFAGGMLTYYTVTEGLSGP
jgi:hypothetical protein